MAIQSFANGTTSDIYHGVNSKQARRVPQKIWKTAQRKMSLLHNAMTTLDLNLPGMNVEPLKYDRPGFYSARINDQFRLIFQFKDGDAFHVGIEDFHGRKQT